MSHLPRRFLEERLRPRSLILPPDPPERAKLSTQFGGERIARDIPSTVRVNANFPHSWHPRRRLGRIAPIAERGWNPRISFSSAFRVSFFGRSSRGAGAG